MLTTTDAAMLLAQAYEIPLASIDMDIAAKLAKRPGGKDSTAALVLLMANLDHNNAEAEDELDALREELE